MTMVRGYWVKIQYERHTAVKGVLKTHNTGISRDVVIVVVVVVVVVDDDDDVVSLRVAFQFIFNLLVNCVIFFLIIYISVKHELTKSSPEK
jgi:hypothetical protein